MGHVNNARYLTYCEIARVRLLGRRHRRAARARRPTAAERHDPRRGPDHLPRAGVLRRALTVEIAGRPDRPHRASRSSTGSPRPTSERGQRTARRDRRVRSWCGSTTRPTARSPSRTRRGAPSTPSRAGRSEPDAPVDTPRTAEDRHRVLAAEAEAVDHRRVDPRLARDVGHVVEVALRVGRRRG